jgi:Alpha-L-arabinofuranosidase B (ABFB) domain
MENPDAASRENREEGPRDLVRPYVTGLGDFNPQAAEASMQGFQAERANQGTPGLLAGEVRPRRHAKRRRKAPFVLGGRRGSLAVVAAVAVAVLAGVLLLVLASRTTAVSGMASPRKPPATSRVTTATLRSAKSPVTTPASGVPSITTTPSPLAASTTASPANPPWAATSAPSPTAPPMTSTPGLTPGSRISIEATTACCTTFSIQHDHGDNRVVITQVTADSSDTSRGDATWIVRPGLADRLCISFESADDPGYYLRHFDFELYLDQDDGSGQFALDATFCRRPGNSGQDYSFESYNYPSMYIRHYDYVVYLAGDGGPLPWDTATLWPDDSTWQIIQPWD